MGLFAVAHLAARHGIRVRLRPAQPRGLTAMVWLPYSVAVPAPFGYGEGLRGYTIQPPVPLAGQTPQAEPSAVPPEPSAVPAQGGGASPWFRSRRPSAGPQPAGAGWPATPAAFGPASSAGGDSRYFQDGPGPVHDGTTAAGLPVRVPQANRIPGSGELAAQGTGRAAAPRPLAAAAPMARSSPGGRAAPRLSPEAARSRLGGFQHGARRAEARVPAPEREQIVELCGPPGS